MSRARRTPLHKAHGFELPKLSDAAEAMSKYIADVMGLFATAENFDGMIWYVGADRSVTFFARCPNLFRHGEEDVEPIRAEDIALLEQCLADLGTWSGLLPELFAARKRGQRPAYGWLLDHAVTPQLMSLFEGCEKDRSDGE